MTPEQAWNVILQVFITKPGLAVGDLNVTLQAIKTIAELVDKSKEVNTMGDK